MHQHVSEISAKPDQDAPVDATTPPEHELTRVQAPFKPEHVPAKFWDARTGQVRVDALIKSYLALEKRLSRSVPLPNDEHDTEGFERLYGLLGRPASPDDYTIHAPHACVQPDCQINARLHAAGFNHTQAQMVYDLAAEYLLPLVDELMSEVNERAEIDRLERQFGGAKGFAEVARQMRAWGEANLSFEVFEALSKSYDGVMTLYRMMQAEPGLLNEAAADERTLDQTQLDSMMRDPRYWRDRDPAFIAKVTEGYKRLYAA